MILCFPSLPKKDVPVVIETYDKVTARLRMWLSANNKPPIPAEFKRLDSIYGLYKIADADKVRVWARDNMYRGRVWGPDVPKELINPEARDCDNIAEHYSYWFHRALPGCPW